jgi:hypothetical protein
MVNIPKTYIPGYIYAVVVTLRFIGEKAMAKNIEICNACNETTCVKWVNSRGVVEDDGVAFEGFTPISECPIRRAILMEDLEDADKSGLMPTRLLGC